MLSLSIFNKSFCLQTLCESNYCKLLQLAPNLTELPETTTFLSDGKPSLHLKILNRSPFTLTAELSHCFSHENEIKFEPAVKIQIYLDSKSTEVLRDHIRPHAAQGIKDFPNPKAVMDYKWTQNYFLERWLDHCLQIGYQFTNSEISEDKKHPVIFE